MDGKTALDVVLVVLVTPKACLGKDFTKFLNRSRAYGRLERIVIDEYYVIMESDDNSFRPALKRLGRLGNFKE